MTHIQRVVVPVVLILSGCTFDTAPVKPGSLVSDVDATTPPPLDAATADGSLTMSPDADLFDAGGLISQPVPDGPDAGQPGTPDDTCASLADEPGCCADDGFCGVGDTRSGLGCRHVPGRAQVPCGARPSNTVTCEPVGTLSLRVNADVIWPGLTPWTDDGRGALQLDALLTVERVDPVTREFSGSARLCGLALPLYQSSARCEVYQLQVPEALWEDTERARAVHGTYPCNTQGCVLQFDAISLLVGTRLDDAAVWPTTTQACDGMCFTDDDGDGLLGVGVDVISQSSLAMSMTYAGPAGACAYGYAQRALPVSLGAGPAYLTPPRSDRLSLALRTRLAGQVSLDTGCQVASVGASETAVELRAPACQLAAATQTSGPALAEPCSAAQALTADQTLPAYRALMPGEVPLASSSGRSSAASTGTIMHAKRFAAIAGPVSCAQARAVVY